MIQHFMLRRAIRPLVVAAGLVVAIGIPAATAAQELPSAEAIAAAVQEQIGLAGISVGVTGGGFTVGAPEDSGASMGVVGADGGTSVALGDTGDGGVNSGATATNAD